MPKYVLYKDADLAQDTIWQYTYEQWGKAQAEKYIRNLHIKLDNLANNKILWQKIPSHYKLKKTVYISRYEEHYIVFIQLGNSDIGVINILHKRSDIPTKLKQNLKKL